MSNHYHLVLHINKSNNEKWTDLEVCQRWHQLFKGTVLTRRFAQGELLDTAENDAVTLKLTQWRENLCSISWFMRLVNEPIARRANTEDRCSRKFWESRFKSQALCDEKALTACMAHVDLNPIRAKIADTLEASEYTSVQQRIENLIEAPRTQPFRLMPFVGNPREHMPEGLPCALKDYLELVGRSYASCVRDIRESIHISWTGRIVREDKRGAISATTPLILARLGIKTPHWLFLAENFESKLKGLVGCAFSIRQAAEKLGYRRSPGLAQCRTIFS